MEHMKAGRRPAGRERTSSTTAERFRTFGPVEAESRERLEGSRCERDSGSEAARDRLSSCGSERSAVRFAGRSEAFESRSDGWSLSVSHLCCLACGLPVPERARAMRLWRCATPGGTRPTDWPTSLSSPSSSSSSGGR